MGLLDYGGTGFHCVHFTDEDIEIFKAHGACAVTCPGSNSKLASGIAPLTKFIDRGITLGVGTDGAASNNCLDMFREMFLMTALQKLKLEDASALPADRVLMAATRGSALAMGLDDCDCIAEGKQADLTVIDLDRPNMRPFNNLPKNLVYSGSKQNVKLTMCAGRVLFEEGRYSIGEDESRIYARCEELAEDLKRR